MTPKQEKFKIQRGSSKQPVRVFSRSPIFSFDEVKNASMYWCVIVMQYILGLGSIQLINLWQTSILGMLVN